MENNWISRDTVRVQRGFEQVNPNDQYLYETYWKVEGVRFDISPEGLDREFELARRRVMIYMDCFIAKKAGKSIMPVAEMIKLYGVDPRPVHFTWP